MQQAREMLASQGAPVTTDNLNRAMLMLTGSGDTRTEQSAEGFDMNAQVDRVMQRSGSNNTPRRPHRNETPRQEAAEPNTNPAEEVGESYAPLPLPPPDVRDAAQSAGQRELIIPGEGMMYAAPPQTSALDGQNNRLGRDALMLAESAGAVTGGMPQVGAGYFGRAGIPSFPNIRLGMNRTALPGAADDVTRLSGPDAPTSVITGGPQPRLPGSGGAQAQLPAPQQALPAPATPPSLPPAQARAMRGPDLPAGTPAGLSPAQRAALLGPGEAGNTAMAAARARSGGGPRGMSRAKQQRESNRTNE